MAGESAKTLIDKVLSKHPSNSGIELKYRPIRSDEMAEILPNKYGNMDDSIVGILLSNLTQNGLIDPDYFPRFLLGSSRLAALSLYGKEFIQTDDFETDDIIQSAHKKKKFFGDLDIDVKMIVPVKEVANFLNSEDQFQGSLATKLGRGEIHLAIKMDNNSVIQIDLVDVSDIDVEAQKFGQYSSFLDLSEGIKGAFVKILLRSIAGVKQPESLSYFEDFAKANPNIDFSKGWDKAISLGYELVGARYIVNPEKLKLAMEFKKEGIKTIKKVFYPDFSMGYNDLDSLANFLLGNNASGNTLLHAIALAEYVSSNFQENEVKTIKERFLNGIEKDVKRGLDPEDYEIGKNLIISILDKTQTPSVLSEGRTGIGRFSGKSKLSNKNTIDIIYDLISLSGNKGKDRFSIDLMAEPEKIDLVEKMDSGYFSFGLDPKKQFFIESSNSGLVYPSVYKQRFSFSDDFLKSYESILNNKSFQKSLNKVYEEFGPFKFNAELFPILTHKGDDEGKVIFVGTSYLKEKFGKDGGITIFNSQLWDKNRNSWYSPATKLDSRVVNSFKELSEQSKLDEDWKVYSNEDMLLPGMLQINLMGFQQFFSSREKAEELKSLIRKKEYKEKFQSIRDNLQKQLDEIANRSTSNLGGKDSYIEGVVLRIKKENGDFYEIKGTSKGFDLNKEEYWKDRVDLLNLEKKLKESLITTVLGLPSAHPTTISKQIRPFVMDQFIQSETLDKQDLIFSLIKQGIIFPGGAGSVEGLKSQIRSLLDSSKQRLREIKDSINKKEVEGLLDTDSIRKSNEIYSSVLKNVMVYEELLQTKDDYDFITEIVFAILGKRLSKIINLEKAKDYEKDSKKYEKVIVIPGRFQPFHKGHMAMVNLAVDNLEKVDGNKVLIYVIKGNESSLDNAKNPLSEKEQIELIRSLFKNNPKVEVAEDVLPSSGPSELVTNIYNKNKKLVGIAAGEDRLPSYKKFIYAFSPSYFKSDHDYTPIDKNSKGHYIFNFIKTPRLFSGTEARELASKVSFEEFLNNVIGEGVSEETKRIYKMVYDKLSQKDIQKEDTQHFLGIFRGLVEEVLKETSKAGKKRASKKIPKLKDEGYPQKQAIAIAYSMEERDELEEEEELEEMTAAGGAGGGTGAVVGYAGAAGAVGRPQRRKRKTTEEEVNEALNYLLQKLGV